MAALTVVIDPGNFSTKYVYRWKNELKVGTFESIAHRYEEMERQFNNEVKRVTYNRFDYYIGKGAARFYPNGNATYMGNKKKGHHEGAIRIIAALHEIYKETGTPSFNVVSTSPYSSMKKDKEYFDKMLSGASECFIDGKEFKFTIDNFRTAAEGLGALAFAKSKDCIVIDAGSMTMNILHIIDGMINANRSDTLNGGTIKHDEFSLAERFSKENPDVEFDQEILVAGGKSEAVAESLRDIGYENVQEVLLENYPAFYANVIGLFLIFEKKFESLFATANV